MASMRAPSRLITAAIVCGSLTITIAAQSGRPMTIQDLLAAIRISDPQLSPDGQTVAFVRTTTDLTSGRRNADIWAVPVNANAASPGTAFLTGEKTENTPRWSPDGKSIAFISTRDGDPQVYLADVAGTSISNIRRITNVSGGVQ